MLREDSMDSQSHVYDDKTLVELLGEGRLTHAQIARRLGMAPDEVADIASGARRPELQEPIEQASLAALRRMRRILRSCACHLAATMACDALCDQDSGNRSTTRRTPEFLVDRLLSATPSGQAWVRDAGAGQPAAPSPRALPGLTSDDLDWLAQRHDGPRE